MVAVSITPVAGPSPGTGPRASVEDSGAVSSPELTTRPTRDRSTAPGAITVIRSSTEEPPFADSSPGAAPTPTAPAAFCSFSLDAFNTFW